MNVVLSQVPAANVAMGPPATVIKGSVTVMAVTSTGPVLHTSKV